MELTTKKQISPKVENIVKGIFDILLAVVMAINVGPVARTFTFLPIYLLGIGNYIVLGFIFFLGIYRLFSGHKFKINKFYNLIALIFLFISVMFFIGYIWGNAFNYDYSQGASKYIYDVNESLKDYYTDKIINMFTSKWPFSSGVIFFGISSSIPSAIAGCGLGIIFLILSLVCFLPALIMKAVKKKKSEKEVKDAIKRAEEYNKSQIEEEPEIIPQPLKLEETGVVQYGFEPEDSSFDENHSAFEPVTMSLDDTYGSSNHPIINNEFSKIDFKNEAEVDPVKTPAVAETTPEINVQQTNNVDDYQIVPNEEIIDEEAPLFEDSYLDENSNNVKNETIVSTPIDLDSFNRPNNQNNLQQIQPQGGNQIMDATIKPEPIQEEKPVKRERVKWIAPSKELLMEYETAEATEQNSKLASERVETINHILSDFKVGARVTSFTIGSSVTRFNIEYEPDVSIKVVEKVIDDISLRLGGVSARFTPLVQGEIFSGLEVPNATITTVSFKEVFAQLPDVVKHPLSVAFGKNISGDVVCADFDEFPHLLVAGTTGSGKSIYIHSIIATLIMRNSPDDLKVVLVDPKKVEMTKYRDMPHLLCPIITEAPKAKVMLDKLAVEMNDRYDKFSSADNASNIKQYNEWAKENNQELLPYIIVVLDEYADLVDTCKEISQPVVSIAQKARAAGIHLLISTQRPSTNVITGVIKGNLPTHVALMTSSSTDSVTIIGEGGAEKLLGKGDMLVQSPLVSRVGVTRLQGCFIQNKEIGHIVGYLKEHYETHYDENYLDLVDRSKEAGQKMVDSGEIDTEMDNEEEAKYQSIKEWVMCQAFVSMSKIQRECGVGFSRAGRFFLRLQKEGIVSTEQDGATKGCKVLVHDKFSNYGGDVGSGELIG